jgi:putative ABC transport system permease protein
LTVPLARRTLLHHRRRLAAALAGVVFAVVLVNMEVGILNGFMANAVCFLDNLPAQVWIMAPGTPNFDMPHNIPESQLERVRSVPGVLWADKMIAGWGFWKTREGTEENTMIMGLPADGHLAIPWPVSPPEAASLTESDAVIIDRFDQARLKVRGPGDVAEVNRVRVRVAGFTTGMRSFTTNPYVLMRYEDAKTRSLYTPGTTHYIAIRAVPGVSPEELRDRLRGTLSGVDVLTAAEFGRRTKKYWLIGTGVGVAFLMSALLGFVVGGAVVGQVLYALVEDQRAEFGVLKAMGAGRAALCRIVGGEALMIALAGYAAGILATIPLVKLTASMGTPILVDWPILAAGFAAVVVTCLGAAILPTLKLMRLEPAMVFRG